MADFDTYFAEHIEPYIDELKERQSDAQDHIVLIIVGVMLAELVLFIVVPDTGCRFLFFLAGLFIILFGRRKCLSSYQQDFSQKVMAKIVQFLDSNLHYERYAHLSQQDYNASELYSTDYDYFTGSDLIWGMYQKTRIKCSFLHVTREEEEEETDEDGFTHTTTYTVTVFSGLLFVADFNKRFKGKVWVRPRSFHFLKSRNTVILENPIFHKYFEVLATDQIIARYVLSTSLIERILKLRSLFPGKRISLSFINSTLYVGIEGLNGFRISIFDNLDDKSLYYNYLLRFKQLLSIVDELNLNTRIWGRN